MISHNQQGRQGGQVAGEGSWPLSARKAARVRKSRTTAMMQPLEVKTPCQMPAMGPGRAGSSPKTRGCVGELRARQLRDRQYIEIRMALPFATRVSLGSSVLLQLGPVGAVPRHHVRRRRSMRIPTLVQIGVQPLPLDDPEPLNFRNQRPMPTAGDWTLDRWQVRQRATVELSRQDAGRRGIRPTIHGRRGQDTKRNGSPLDATLTCDARQRPRSDGNAIRQPTRAGREPSLMGE